MGAQLKRARKLRSRGFPVPFEDACHYKCNLVLFLDACLFVVSWCLGLEWWILNSVQRTLFMTLEAFTLFRADSASALSGRILRTAG